MRRRLRLIQAKVRSTIQRFGSKKKRCASLRFTISIDSMIARATNRMGQKTAIGVTWRAGR